jgi:hypothetical protein
MHRKNTRKIYEKEIKLSIIFLTFFSIVILVLLSFFLFSHTFTQEQIQEKIENLPLTGEDTYRVFVTSTKIGGNIKGYKNSASGIEGADKFCQDTAGTAGLGGKWIAFLADMKNVYGTWVYDTYPFSRVKARKYYLMNGSVAVDWTSGVKEGPLAHPISITENGTELSGDFIQDDDNRAVWSGIVSWGGVLDPHANTYDNWTVSGIQAAVGAIINGTQKDSDWYSWGSYAGSYSLRLYCFEQYKDRDKDGYTEDVDCNDNDPTVHPGAVELCDGIDNNCNGSIDEGFNVGAGCSSGIGECRRDGTIVCSSDKERSLCSAIPGSPTPEVCDGKDNDCNGKIDDGVARMCGSNVGICTYGLEICTNGQWGTCSGIQPQQEICDGLDNNCNGVVDEGCSCSEGAVRQCGSAVGTCKKGTQQCTNGTWGNCQGSVGPQTEVCDGLDNNCNGIIDENLTRSCGVTQGTCKAGTQTCSGGNWGACQGEVTATAEVCDGIDNNCDGTVDEGCVCTSGAMRECGSDIGECKKGMQTCTDGQWGNCIGSIKPQPEICDKKDNNCNNEIDEGGICDEISAYVANEGENQEAQQIENSEAESQQTQESFSDLIINFVKSPIFISIIVLLGGSMIGVVMLFLASRSKQKKALKRFQSVHKAQPDIYTKRSPLD